MPFVTALSLPGLIAAAARVVGADVCAAAKARGVPETLARSIIAAPWVLS